MSEQAYDVQVPGADAGAGPTRRIRIAVVTETYPPEINGVARTIGITVDWLLERGHAVELVRPRQRLEPVCAPRAGLHETLTAGAVVPKWQVPLGFALPGTLAARWRSAQPDLVHIVTEGPLGWAAMSAARSLRIPLSSDFHTNFHRYSRHYGFAWMESAVAAYLRWLHNRTGCTLVPTEQLKSELEHLGIERLRIAGRGVDSEMFNPARRSAELRRQWGCLGDELVVISVGRLAPEKGLDLFATAACSMLAANPAIRVVIVGDGPLRASLERRNPGFHFAGARVGADLAAHYASADVFLFPSTTETFGNVVIEAMASGLAVLAYDDAAARQHIGHMTSGLLAPRGDAELFTHLAAMLAHDPALRLALGREARRVSRDMPWKLKLPKLEAALLEKALQTEAEPSRDGDRQDPAKCSHAAQDRPGPRW
ncbi:MAG TPA: glycosyltransferase family 1 protein [Burkholderiales bacterium]|nr:glycosyltransferase family 1 protein [Burkholderiales bacterium]